MKKIFLFPVFIMFCACATLPSKNIPQNFNPESNEGMIIGAIAIQNEKPIFNGYTFFYSGQSKRGFIDISPEQTIKMKFKPDFFDNDKAVYYFSITAIPGAYKFYRLSLFSNGGYMQSTNGIPLDIDFEIEKGKVKYIGEFYVNYNGEIYELRDNKNRDLPKLKEVYPNLNIE